MKYRGPCIDCGAFKDQQYIRKRCIACYRKFHRYNDEFKPHRKYNGPCIHCGSMKSRSGRFVRKMCEQCYNRFKLTGDPSLKEKKRYKEPCITCGTDKPGYAKYFQEKMCSKCYRHYSYFRDRPKIELRFCIDCEKKLRLYAKTERCRRCNRRYKWKKDPVYREQRNRINKQYSQTSKGKKTGRAHVRRRRAELAKVENTLTNNEWQEVLNSFYHRCAYCSSDEKIEMDHIIPISKNGPHIKENVVPACRRCNSRKNNKSILEFLLAI